jgi:hypothetical protein
MKTIISVMVILLSCVSVFGQARWKFYVAFEDATGARDTLWMVYDTTAHGNLPVDTGLGEGKFNFDHSVMNVWVYNADFDSTKTIAFPYSSFPYHSIGNIMAFNYVYPITISWDTALFHSPILPSQPIPYMYINDVFMYNEYFHFVNNDPPKQAFNMLINNSAVAPPFGWGTTEHFPMTITVQYNSQTVINENSDASNKVLVYPSPFDDGLRISTEIPVDKYFISSLDGKIMKIVDFEQSRILSEYSIDTRSLAAGIYLLTVSDSNANSISTLKIFKSN